MRQIRRMKCPQIQNVFQEQVQGAGIGVLQVEAEDGPNVNIESPPSMHPPLRICDITGFEAPYHDPRTNLRYANTDVFKLVRSLPNEHVQRYLALRNAAVTLK
uniref:Vps72/YL1 C-terminal domain-containing protein n=1 Tax=Populus alba TaxID=43335 RepID=A0A4U5QAH5_POPAL|nr:hypothetical protein D5086_0000113580 [Populus alba]